MAKNTIKEELINLSNIEIFEFCQLNIKTGNKDFFDKYESLENFVGFYYKDNQTFFALFSSADGPQMYYKGKTYRLKKELNIHIEEKDYKFIFNIEEYELSIEYNKSEYEDLDSWSDRENVDLFYKIEHSYKDDKFYAKFTLKS